MAIGGGDSHKQSLAALTGESLIEAVEQKTQKLLGSVAVFEKKVRRYTANTEVLKRGDTDLHTRLPSTLIGLFSMADTLVAAFDCPENDAPEVADLLRVYRLEGPELRLAPNSLAHHKGLSRWIRDLYLSYKGRVRFVEVVEEAELVILAFEVHHGANRPPRRHVLGMDLRDGIKLVRNPMPSEPLAPDFTALKELREAPWQAGERTNAYYNHAQVGPAYAFLEWGELKLRDYLERPRGEADLVIPNAADPEHSVVPHLSEYLSPSTGQNEALLHIQAEADGAHFYFHYQKEPKTFKRLDPQEIPGLKLPGRLGKITAMCLWTGGELIYLGGLPAAPSRRVDAPTGSDCLFIFQDQDGLFTLHHFLATSRQVLHSFQRIRGYSLNADGLLFLAPLQGDEPQSSHHLSTWITPFRRSENGLSAAQQAYLKSFEADQVEAMAGALRAIKSPISDQNFRQAREILDRTLVQWPFLERVKDIRKDIQLLHDSLDKCLAIESELETIFEKRRETLADFQDDVENGLSQIDPKPSQGIDGVLKAIGVIRTFQGRLEQQRTQKHLPSDVIAAYDGLAEKLKANLDKRSAQGGRRCDRLIKDAQKETTKILDAAPSTANLLDIEKALAAIATLRQKLIQAVDSLKLLALDPNENLRIAQAGTAEVVACDRCEKALRAQRKALSQNEKQESFQTLTIQLDLQIATEPGNILQIDEVTGRLEALLAEIEAKKSEYQDYPELRAALSTRQAQAKDRYEARKLELTQERTQAEESLSDEFQLHISALELAAQATTLKAEALEGFLVGHGETLACQKIIERLTTLGLHGQAALLGGQLDRKRRQLVIQRQEREIFAVEGETLFLGGVRFHRNRLALAIQERFDRGGFALQVAGTGLILRGDRLGDLKAPPTYIGHVNESEAVSRAEYLAYRILLDADEILTDLDDLEGEKGLEILQSTCKERVLALRDEAHTLGLHDRDAALILAAILPRWQALGPLRWPSALRVQMAQAWMGLEDRQRILSQAQAMLSLERLFSGKSGVKALLKGALGTQDDGLPEDGFDYLMAELERGALEADGAFIMHPEAHKIAHRMAQLIGEADLRQALLALGDLNARMAFLEPEVRRILKRAPAQLGENQENAQAWAAEIAWILATGQFEAPDGAAEGSSASPERVQTRVIIHGLTSEHARADGPLSLDIPTWYQRLSRFHSEETPQFRAFRGQIDRARAHFSQVLELDTLIPKPLAGFAWTRLLKRVYLPMIASALQKQLGHLDDPGQDRMGVLLLVSPPGYGKTELLKKITQLMGYAFVTISGTALGKDTHALDPEAAPNRAAAAALRRLIRGLEFQDNIILDIEDVQACSPAFLEKLLPLCDATRTLEIPLPSGEIKRIDLHGKRLAVVMTLNPLGATIPQALANRASLINLGDVADRHHRDFALSYLEVAAPANATLEAVQAQGDLETLYLALEEGRAFDSLERDLNGRYSEPEFLRIHKVLTHLLAIRDVMLKVNEACLHSATVEDIYRVKPAFELQGSYRDMIEISRKVEADWDAEQRMQTILTHYEGQAGLLGQQGEANLLTLRELLGLITPEEAERLAHIQRIFRLNQEREQTLLALLDRLTEVTEAVQAIPQAIKLQSESIFEPLEALGTALHTLPFEQSVLNAPREAARAQAIATQFSALLGAMHQLSQDIQMGSSQLHQEIKGMVDGLIHALVGTVYQSPAPASPGDGDMHPALTQRPRPQPSSDDAPQPAGDALYGITQDLADKMATLAGDDLTQNRANASDSQGDAPAATENASTPMENPTPGEQESAASDALMAGEPTDSTAEAPLDVEGLQNKVDTREKGTTSSEDADRSELDDMEALALSDPEAFLAQFLNPSPTDDGESAKNASSREPKRLVSLVEPESVADAQKLPNALDPSAAAPQPETDKGSQTDSETQAPDPATPWIHAKHLSPEERGEEIDLQDEKSNPPAMRSPQLTVNPPQGGLAQLLFQALSSATVQVALQDSEPPIWAQHLQGTLQNIHQNLDTLAQAANRPKEKPNLLQDLKKLLNTLPEE